jgi:addiction module RelE/StbE family toxin
MRYKIQYLGKAVEDIKAIKAYLSRFYPNTPVKFLSVLKKHVSDLQDMPYMYAVYEDVPAYRKLLVSGYLVFYKVNEEKKPVEIHRILSGSRDVARDLAP